MISSLGTSKITTEDILSRIGSAVFLVGNNGAVIYANSRLTELTGISAEQIIGRPYNVLFGQIAAQADDARQTLKTLRDALEHVQNFPIQEIELCKPLTRRLQITLFPLPENRRRAVWGGGLQEIASTYEGSLGARNPQHAGVLFSLIDELRSALVFIIGCASTLVSEHYAWSKEEVGAFLGLINSKAKDSIQMLENVRDISKLELNELELRARPVNLKRLIQHVAQQLMDHNDHVDIRMEIPDDLPMVDLDAIRMSRGLQNLLESILKLSFDSKIRIRAQQVNTTIQVDINYQGMRLPENLGEESLKDVLEARLQNPQMVRDFSLRFYIAQGIFRAHNGRFWMEDASLEAGNQHTVLHLSLPLSRSALSAPSPSELYRADFATELTPISRSANRPKTKVLVIDHDPKVLDQLKSQSDFEDFNVIHAREGAAGLELAAIDRPDIILLSYTLPDADGLTICKELRHITTIPIIVMANAADEETTIQCLNAGADDCIPKPLRTRELLARIRADLRRTVLTDIADKSNGDTVLKAGDLIIDFSQRRVTRQGKPIDLTPIEYKLLYNLVMNKGRILTHEQLVSRVWGPMFRQETQYLWVNISRLRAKLESDPAKPQFILTERGVGYSFHNPDEDVAR